MWCARATNESAYPSNMYVRFVLIQAAVIATAVVALTTFVAITHGSDYTVASWAIPLAWALVFATLMLATVRLESRGPMPGAHFILALILNGSALVISVIGIPSSPVLLLTSLSALLLLTGIRRQRSLIEYCFMA